MTQETDIRKEVSRAYAEAVSRPAAAGGCCSGPSTSGGCCSAPDPKGVAARSAGYRDEDLADLPDDAVANSFGCGNPLAFSEVRPGEVVLDLGSGAGIDLLIASKKVGPSGRVIGVDMTEEMIARARANVEAAGAATVEVRKGYIEELPVEDSSVDWVISNCVINLSPDKARVFSEIARVLRPGGRMLVSDIVVSDLPEELRQDKALYSSCVAGAISEEKYLEGLRRAGLEEVRVTDRVVYTADHLKSFVESELPGGYSCSEERLDHLARQVEGKVWSARFAARRS